MTAPHTPDETPKPPREQPFDLTRVGTRPIDTRPTLVNVGMYGGTTGPLSTPGPASPMGSGPPS